MDHPYRSSNNLFQSPQLPPPSQLHLSSFSRSNTLPPIPPLISANSSRFQQYSQQSLPPLPSTTSYNPLHRTSSSRDDHRSDRDVKREPSILHHHHDSHQLPQLQQHISSHQQQQQQVPPPPPPQQQQQNQSPHKEVEDGMPSTSDFVKKLYKMLEDPAFTNVVSWGPQGDCFVVKDMNEFTKSILPRMFKHSNFASFVRQLNKYDFHKVKNTDDNQFGEHSWTFRHPDFHADRRDSLENIKRKVPAQRKPTTASTTAPSTSSQPNGHTSSASPTPTVTLALQAQIERMATTQDALAAHIRNLERNYQEVLVEMVNFQRNMAQQDGLMQNLIQYFLQIENAKMKDQQGSSSQAGPSQQQQQTQSPFLAAQDAQRMMGNSYSQSTIARESLAQMSAISQRAEAAGMSFGPTAGSSNSTGVASTSGTQDNLNSLSSLTREAALARIGELQMQRSRPPSAQGFSAGDAPFIMPEEGEGGGVAGSAVRVGGTGLVGGSNSGAGTGETLWQGNADAEGGLQVFTLGHLMPKSTVDDGSGGNAWNFTGMEGNGAGSSNAAGATSDANGAVSEEAYEMEETVPASNNAGSSATPNGVVYPPARLSTAQKLRVRRSTFVPGWAVPPRVLLVDDDAVSRTLSSKFLQVFGCTIDVAVDGVGAVNKMNLERYDLVLMDIVMPKLDGVSATSLIRQFDHLTPIISMTSNSKPNEIMTYYSSGMNDILAKPFTKQGLLDMLEKHLMHLKVMEQMSRVPRSVGIPPLSDSGLERALTSQAAQASMPGLMSNLGGDVIVEDDGRINPLAGMGLTDEQYGIILQGLVNGESFPGVVGLQDPSGASSSTGGMSLGLGGGGLGEKRGLEDADGREGPEKRGRFEVVE